MADVGTELAGMLPSMDGFITFALMFAGIIIFGLIVFAIVYSMLFKHRLEIKTNTHSDRQGMPIIVRCRQYKDEAGIEYWKPFFKPGIGELPAPPMEYRELRGRESWKATCYLVEGEPRWIRSTLSQVLNPEGKPDTEVTLQVFNGTQRWAYMNSIKRAMKKAENWKQMILPAIGMGMCLMCLVLMVIFYDDATDKPIEMQNLANQALETMKEITKQQAITTDKLNTMLTESGLFVPPQEEGRPTDPPG